jgi:fibronectin type 3 domain-containing protein
MNRNAPGFTLFFGVGSFLALAQLILAFGCSKEPAAIQPATMALSGRITLTWDPVPQAASYNVYFSPTPGATTQTAVKIENAANPITIRDLKRGNTYYFFVTAVSASGVESGASAEMSHTAE